MSLPTYKPLTPGDILKETFLDPLSLTQGDLADWLSVERRRINEIVRGKREVTPDTAIRLAKAFGMSPMFWLNLQTRYNLWQALQEKQQDYNKIKPIRVL